ncbi:DUF1801 domain-containing protein [Enterococcus saccharolyticus]|uniref:iron chaperone n=1 Tax=Enterococcus TaxID=1350 RepID=UPI001E2F94EB|nr:DUF1801 domain-containing protein [Enterococcus saccharolyticus]MCD5001003.1 DUF1801 domain-containing protein [Enterococcus saccharolyticus]
MFIEYIAQAPKEHQKYLNKMYQLLKEELPEATEKFSYGMPTFYWKKNVVHFADNTKHLGFYPTPTVITAFKENLTKYKFSKGAVQFPYSEPFDETLIREMVRFRKTELEELQ